MRGGKESMKKEPQGRRSRRRLRGYAAVMLLVLLASLALLNVGATELERRLGWRVDASFNAVTSYGAKTREVLEKLAHPVHIYAVYRRGQEDGPLLELLDRYAAATPLLTWEQVDPGMNPALLQRFSTESRTVNADELIVYGPDAERWRVLGAEDFVSLSLDETGEAYTAAGWTYEQSLTRAIDYVTRERIPRIVIAQGHGELDQEATAAFRSLLEENQYEMIYSGLSGETWDWSPEDLLAFFSPLRDLTGEELERVRDFAGKGGSLLFTCDYTDPLKDMGNYRTLMRSYGFVPLEGIVVADRDAPETYDQDVRIRLIPELCSTDLTMDLVASGRNALILPGARAFETQEETDRYLTLMTVLQSGEGAYLKVLTSKTTSMEPAPEDPRGPFPLALEARRVTEEGYVSRALAFGCSALLTERQLWAMTDSQPLILRSVEFLLNAGAAELTMMARDGLRPGLRAESGAVGSIVLTALPACVPCVALLILLPRRRRGKKERAA